MTRRNMLGGLAAAAVLSPLALARLYEFVRKKRFDQRRVRQFGI